ncbi:hypothetical protein TrVE_jg727 [Triparma verrucosa]|uniref:Uncharacterized protein n=1 Tax=Triparma verrucosa TaxID=1606542 RepID=A0A9W7CDA5_9STRA|nr:hypothetical protein TrVE_jg727 [Triparma verrucosa]
MLDSDLESCFHCENCPPKGGQCRNGFKRADSINCDVCPANATNFNNNCVTCPDNSLLSFLLSFLVFVLLALVAVLLYILRNNRYLQSILPEANVTNLIRTKQITAALSILTVFAGLSYNLSTWFKILSDILSTISMPVEVKPVCQTWYEGIQRGDNYFTSAWMAFIFVYGVSFLLRYAHKLTWVLPPVLSFLALSIILYVAIRHSSQNLKRIRAKLLEAETISTEETIEDIELQGPYYSAFCLQYTPQMYNHEEKAFLRKFLWIAGMKAVQFVAVVLASKGSVENLACVKTAACSIVLVATNIWYTRYLLRSPYASHRPSSTMGDPLNDAEMRKCSPRGPFPWRLLYSVSETPWSRAQLLATVLRTGSQPTSGRWTFCA